MSFTNVMLDLETRGQRPGCAILSIGAVAFGPLTQTLGAEFYTVVNTKSCHEAGLQDDESTMVWWRSQAPEAQKVLVDADTGGVALKDALQQFGDWVKQFGGFQRVKVWGNGSDFDNAIMACCYHAVDLPPPWQFWNNRCYRTLKSLVPNVKLKREGTYHNALDDAKSQAKHLCLIAKGLPPSIQL